MSRNRRIALVAAAIPITIIVLVLAAFGFDRFTHRGQVFRESVLQQPIALGRTLQLEGQDRDDLIR